MARLSFCILLVCGAAGADEPAERKAHLFSDQGMERFRKGDYDAAITAFQSANALAPRPILLFNLGQAYRLKGDCRRALDSYRAYLDVAPDATNRPRVEAFIANLPCAQPPAQEPAPTPSPEPPKLEPPKLEPPPPEPPKP